MRELWSKLLGGKQVNGFALLILTVTLVVVGGGVYFLHGFQLRRNARGLYDQAKLAESEGKPDQAAAYLEQYLGLNPGDTDALAKLGLLLKDQAKSPRARVRAFRLLDQVLRRDGGRQDIRREAARLASQLGLYSDGKEHLEILLKTGEPDAELLHLSGRCEAGLHKIDEAALLYRQAMAKAPQNTDIVFEYAAVLRERPNLRDLADDEIEKMVLKNPRSPEIRLRAARHLAQHGAAKAAWRHVTVLLDGLGPRTDEVLLLAGDVALSLGEIDEARKLFEQGRQLAPDDPRMSRGLAQVEVRQGEPAKALQLLERTELPEDPIELWRLANVFIDSGDVAKTRACMILLGKAKASGLVGLLEARLHMAKGSWGQAAKLLDAVRLDPQFPKDLGKHANLQIADCCDHLLNPDRKLEALRRAVDLDPDWPPARRALARTLAASGKLDPAIAELRRLAAQAAPAKEDLARLLVDRNLRLPPAQRDWTEATGLLDKPPQGRDGLSVKLLGAEILVLQDKVDDARALAEALRDAHPKEVGPWLLLVALAQRKDAAVSPLDVLAQAEKRAGPRVEWSLSRATLALRAGLEEARRQLPKLLEGESQFQGNDRDKFLAGFANAFAAAGDLTTARRLWAQLAQRTPENLGVLVALFDAALEAKEPDEARRIVNQIQRLEGGDGPYSACGDVAIRLALADPKDKQALAEARPLLARAAAQRPSWARIPLLEAAIFEREGQLGQALEKYKAALDRGEGRITVVRRTLQLMYEQRRYGEAGDLLRKLPEQALALPEMGRLAAQLTLVNQERAGEDPQLARQRALELARKSVSADSKEYREFLWLGQIAALAGQKDEAEKALRRACVLGPTAPEAWTTVIFFLARHDPKKAEAELAQARKLLVGDQAALALGPCYEVLGKLKEAEEQYQAAVKSRPDDPTVLRAAVAHYVRTGQPDKAAVVLRTMLQPGTKVTNADLRWARRSLALNLALQGGAQRYAEALTLLGFNETDGPAVLEDRLAKAMVKATHPTQRREAILEFEQLTAQNTTPGEYQSFLAQLYEQDGNWAAAERHLTALIAAHSKVPLYLARYIVVLLRQKKAEEAQPWVDQLVQLAPKALETLELRLLVLEGRNLKSKALELVDGYAKDKDARLDVVARWLERLDQPVRARKTYEAFAAASKQPETILLVAQFLGRQKKLDEALQICEQAWKQCAPEAVAGTCLGLLRGGSPSQEQRQRVERWLTDAQLKQPKSVGLHLLVAEFHDQQGRTADAVTIYRRLLKENSKNIVALNNLAYMLALNQGDTTEALKLVNAAIEISGPVGQLLDTRAVVYLAHGRPVEALADLKEANLQAPAAAQFFHAAQAHLRADERKEAVLAYQRGLELGLAAAELHPLERAAFEKLQAELR